MSQTSKTTNDTRAALSKRLHTGIVIPTSNRSQLTESLRQLGVTDVFVGTIEYAGSYTEGEYAVQFNDQATNTGYASVWPQWAFDFAKAALLSNKRVAIISNGQPFGSNLTSVLIIAVAG
jgi:hypothetical protein